jgi:hypothetical protein
MLHCEIPVKNGFIVSKVVVLMLQTRNGESSQRKDDLEMRALLDEDDMRT